MFTSIRSSTLSNFFLSYPSISCIFSWTLFGWSVSFFNIQFSSVTQSCPTLCDPMNCRTTEQLHFHFSLLCIGEGNGNPLQCSCLENPRDGGTLCSAIYGVTQSQTRLKWLSSSSSRPPCPSPTPGVHPNPCPLSQWCHLIISSSVIPFSSCPQSFPTSGSLPMSQLFASGDQSTGVSASTSVLPMNTQDWSPLGGLVGSLAVQGTLKSLLQHHSWKASVLQHSAFFIVQLLHPYMTTEKILALTRWNFVDKVMSLLFNMLSRLVMICLWSWLVIICLWLCYINICICLWFGQSSHFLSLFIHNYRVILFILYQLWS